MKFRFAFSILTLLWVSTSFAQTISTTALSSTSFCQNESLDVDFTITGTYNSGNSFTAELSDASGSFTSPVTIGTLVGTSAGTISATLPNLMTSGTLYRIRVVASNPAVTGTDNGSDLTITGSTTNPATFGSSSWNVFCYSVASYTNNTSAFDYSNYQGVYTEPNVSFESTDHYGVSGAPSDAPGYTGCTVTNDRHIVQYKREGFPCAYYQINVAGPNNEAGFDDAAKLVIDGTTVWSNGGCCQAISNIWTGVLGASSQVEFVWSDNGGQSYGRLTFVPVSFPELGPDVTICPGSSTTLTASGASTYDWSTNSTHLVPPLNAPSVVCAPPGGTATGVETYTVTTTDGSTGCSLSNSIDVLIDPNVTTVVTPNSGSYCGTGSIDVVASGAYTYTYSPMTGVTLNSASGHLATLSPTTTTTYTVTGSNNCTTSTATVTVTVTSPSGDPNIFGSNTWNVYGYEGNNFNTYMGFYVDNTLDFDTRTVWGNNNSPSDAPGYSGCTISPNQHSFAYKREGFPCGFYSLDIPNHDDHINLIIDGVSVFSQNSWFANNYKADVWQGYLDQNSTIEYTIREFGGGSNGGLTFHYLYGPSNNPNETVWNGNVSTDWFDAANWCNTLPSTTISAIIPTGRSNYPDITANATVNDLVIASGASLSVTGSNQIEVNGDWNNAGSFTANNSTVIMMGSGTDTIFGTSAQAFHNLTINKGVVTDAITLDVGISVDGNLTFTNGICTTGSDTIVLNNGAAVSGTSDNSYVNGFVRKVGNSAFTFPVGSGGNYRAISISAPSSASDHFTASYYPQNPDNASYSSSALVPSLDHVSTCEYWILDRTAGSSNVSVTLSWDASSCGVTDLSTLAVARWDGSQWDDHGNGATTGTTASGTITSSAAITNFSPFTLASTGLSNPLPVELLQFDATVVSKHEVTLDWSTASELNSDRFYLSRSRDLSDWETIGEVSAAGFSNSLVRYDFTDYSPYEGTFYYRLAQVDMDGTVHTYPAVAVTIEDAFTLGLYPNPAANQITISGVPEYVKEFKVINSLGVNISRQIQGLNTGTRRSNYDISALPAGLYHVIVDGNSISFVKR